MTRTDRILSLIFLGTLMGIAIYETGWSWIFLIHCAVIVYVICKIFTDKT